MHLADLIDGRWLFEMIEHGYIKVQTHPDDRRYEIYNYTDKAVYDRMWNEATRNCRGLITFMESDAHMRVVIARPFKKFFNYGEAEAPTLDLDARVAVLDKVDGSLGILYMAPDGLPAIATRGSFASKQALHATALYRERYHGKWNPDLDAMTYLFEIVYPENRIVLDYEGLDDLFLLGAVHKESGTIWSASGCNMALDNWTGPMGAEYGIHTVGEALAFPPRDNAEGFVLREVGGNQRMVKVKQEDYLRLHKIIFGLTERSVWEALAAGKTVREVCDGLPDEFHGWVTEVGKRLFGEFLRVVNNTAACFYHAKAGLPEGTDLTTREGKKAFAEAIQSTGYTQPGLLFALRDGKDISPAIWDLIRPEHRPFTTTAKEAA